MIVCTFGLLDIGVLMEFMNSWITPVPHFFVRNHMHMPSTLLDTSDWRLNIGGEVEKPVSLTTADLRRLAQHSVTSALECAGNRRSLQRPIVPGVQWQRRPDRNARFSGTRLRDELDPP